MLVGKEFGPYLVDKELGSGAMGTVFRAKHNKSGDRVAIKLMSLALGSNETAINRFVHEVSMLKKLDHPNIVRYKGSGRYHGSPFYIMEYVEGESLDHLFHRKKRLSWEEVVEIGIHLCAGLQHAHDKGIIHRDLKPSNLMLLSDGTIKLTDFGIAKDTDMTALTAANSTVGTAAYMSPEQCRGVRDITHKTDLYSMGIMFYELLTGRKPFVGETPMEVFLQHANKTDYKRPTEIVMEVPIWLDTLVCQLMEKDPSKRPLNANAVADSLKLIKEKIETQRSAGIEAATKRKIDRSTGDKKLDEEDKEAARALLGKKKKKEKAQPFYTRGWFTLSALMVILALSALGVYWAFLRTPSAEALYAEAETLMKSDPRSAREGPIALFLNAYPKHEKLAEVQKWADDIDFETLDKQMHNRRHRNFKEDGPDEQLFRSALQSEDDGKLADATSSWEQLAKKKGSAEHDAHVWGVLGERYLAALRKVESEYRNLGKKSDAMNDFEKLAVEAMKNEVDLYRHIDKAGKEKNDVEAKTARDAAEKHRTVARAKWEELESAAKRQSARSWQLMAAWRKEAVKTAK